MQVIRPPADALSHGPLNRDDRGGLEDALRAVDLLGQDDAHERMGQGQRRERPALVGAPETAWIEPVDPADQEGDIARSFPVHTLHLLRNEWPELQGPL